MGKMTDDRITSLRADIQNLKEKLDIIQEDILCREEELRDLLWDKIESLLPEYDKYRGKQISFEVEYDGQVKRFKTWVNSYRSLMVSISDPHICFDFVTKTGRQSYLSLMNIYIEDMKNIRIINKSK